MATAKTTTQESSNSAEPMDEPIAPAIAQESSKPAYKIRAGQALSYNNKIYNEGDTVYLSDSEVIGVEEVLEAIA